VFEADEVLVLHQLREGDGKKSSLVHKSEVFVYETFCDLVRSVFVKCLQCFKLQQGLVEDESSGFKSMNLQSCKSSTPHTVLAGSNQHGECSPFPALGQSCDFEGVKSGAKGDILPVLQEADQVFLLSSALTSELSLSQHKSLPLLEDTQSKSRPVKLVAKLALYGLQMCRPFLFLLDFS